MKKRHDHSKRWKHDIAYACFLPPGLLSLIAAISMYFPMDTGTAGGIGFLILIPLSLLALTTVPIGVYYSVVYWRDAALVILSLGTILTMVQMFAEIGPVQLRNVLGLVYGVLVFALEVAWFLERRGRTYAT